ncbi:hypothetical protein CYLTODRAFT_150310 [Cylindrobasidium torrendii FP15055 ss-10]|uniref:BTB domain-containing protein n=1 Tax=Cylindrobasidium torrendii FP15055 ss-10 TaxID=1314674 RepID=A0A0D7AXV3_9AGAR|nr:hypothetical protein CYLTODRAFT_150310 [Cylindrobasidium torrendii FP15055 ss-10]
MPANAPLAFLLEPPPPPSQQTPHNNFGSARLYRRRRNRMSASATSPHDLQSHLYQSFLDGKTTDVALRVTGSWSATYHLHRVVLIQSGFFRSLFLTSGFAESSPKSPRTRASFQDELNVVFDDQNITRAG